MAMVGGTITANAIGKNDPGFLHNGPLAGLVAICAGSDIVHPVSALVIGGSRCYVRVSIHLYPKQTQS